MKIASFFRLVEIQTKLASVLPFAIGTLFAVYKYGEFNTANFFMLLISILFFDMTTTAINNYFDDKRAIAKQGYNYETFNSVVKQIFNEKTVVSIIFIMLSIASVFGVLLYLNTDVVVLLLGILSFGVGIFYSFGPIPISRTPFGEIVSGFFMGFILILLAVYVHVQDMDFIKITFENQIFDLKVNMFWAMEVFVLCVPSIAGISNIMLANNICDMDEDIVNKRYTLPIHVGKHNALVLFRTTYIIGFVSILIGVIFKVLPWLMILSLLVAIPVFKNVDSFFKLQSKKDTFALSVKSFLILAATQGILLGIAVLIK